MMNFFSSSAARILLSLALLSSHAYGHGVEVRSCITDAGNLRIYIEHWHGVLANAQAAGTMNIQNDITGEMSTLFPTGIVNNVDITNGGVLPGCAETTLVNTCNNPNPYDDWVYYDFPYECTGEVSYTLILGNTVVLQEGCNELYPATIHPYAHCENVPTPSPTSAPTTAPTTSPTTSPTTTPVLPSPAPTPTPSLIPSESPSISMAPSPCQDTKGKFEINRKNPNSGDTLVRGCVWLEGNMDRINRYCDRDDVKDTCPFTCCECDNCVLPTPSPSKMPTSAPSQGIGKGGKGGKGIRR